MDRFRQKARKDKPKHTDKEKSPLFITDVKTIRENLKIKEILRTVKMNSSMRMKAPRGSKVMQNKDFNDNDDFEDLSGETNQESVSAVNLVLNNDNECMEVIIDNSESENSTIVRSVSESNIIAVTSDQNGECIQEYDTSEIALESKVNDRSDDSITTIPKIKTTLIDDSPRVIPRQRKLSLDQTMWTRRQSLSQSEIDLHSIGKSPLERKSSFFRKKMDSFLKNTTEIFKKQTVSRSQSEIVRRGSISVSLQSLNEKNAETNNASSETINQVKIGSTTSLHSSVAGRSASSLVTSQTSLVASQASLVASQEERTSPPPDQEIPTTDEMLSRSVNSLNDSDMAQGLLNSRAISMSSGLDTAVKRRKRKTSWANRVTWLASETMTNYLKRVIPDDYNKDLSTCHSYQDLSSIPENHYGSETDSKGRRLSYQRAVSGEDPVLQSRYTDPTWRRKNGIPESFEADCELTNILAVYSDKGVPRLKGYRAAIIGDTAFSALTVAETTQGLEELVDPKVELTPNEEARQAVVRELVSTEANYIKHLIAIVEVFISAAHALQDAGKLLDVDTERLFSNIPDVLNASLHFWEETIFPMLSNTMKTKQPLDTEYMSEGFCRFRDVFVPYEKYVSEQTRVLDYLRSLTSNADFMTYLTWCHGHKSCNRLQLSDMLAKPMQRLTKYSLILRRIIAHTDYQPERTSLMAMESFAKNYVLDLNRAIRQKEELEMLDAIENSIDPYEIEFKDEDIDKYFRMYTKLHLKAPMVNHQPNHSRSLIFQGDLRFKDNVNPKEIEVHVVLLTDMILICKKQSKGSEHPYKLIRPKYMLDKVLHFPRYHRNNKDIVALIFIVVDDVGSSTFGFCISESNSSKQEPSIPPGLKIWEQKVREARLCYDLGVWLTKNPSRVLSEGDTVDSSSEYAISAVSGASAVSALSAASAVSGANAVNAVSGASALNAVSGASAVNAVSGASAVNAVSGASAVSTVSAVSGPKPSSDDAYIEREARERVAVMLHRSMGASTEHDCSQASLATDSIEGTSGARTSGARNKIQRDSTGGSSSRNSRLSSFQQSTSAASHDEPGPSGTARPLANKAASTDQASQHEEVVASITVHVVSESESETVVPSQEGTQPSSPSKLNPHLSAHSFAQSSGSLVPVPHAHGHSTGHIPGPASPNTLHVQPQNAVAMVHSLPDLTFNPSPPPPPPRPHPTPNPQTASEKLYQSHQELLLRNRLSAAAQHHQYLTPDHRGSSYPPPSPTRASLKRGLAFSYSFKNPPLTKMGHVNSQSQQLQTEAGPSSGHQSPSRSERAASPMPALSPAPSRPPSLAPSRAPSPTPGPSSAKVDKSDKSEKSDKADKKSKHVSTRNKSGGSVSPSRKDKEEKTSKQDKASKEKKDKEDKRDANEENKGSKEKGTKGKEDKVKKSGKDEKVAKMGKDTKGNKGVKDDKDNKPGKEDKEDKEEKGDKRDKCD